MSRTTKLEEGIALSGDNIRRAAEFAGYPITVMTYGGLPSDLDAETLDMLLEPGDGIALLYETTPDFGHWTLLMRYLDDGESDVIEFMDSYGLSPDSEFSAGASFSARRGKILSDALDNWKKTGGIVNVNRVQLQDLAPRDNTCGRYVLFRWLTKKMGVSLEQFQMMFPGPPEKNDNLIVKLTTPLLGAVS